MAGWGNGSRGRHHDRSREEAILRIVPNGSGAVVAQLGGCLRFQPWLRYFFATLSPMLANSPLAVTYSLILSPVRNLPPRRDRDTGLFVS